MGGMLSLPAWANAWRPETVRHTGLLTTDQKTTLAAVVDTIIPETDTPGAKALNVADFLERMVADCQPDEDHTSLKDSLNTLNAESVSKDGKPFASLDSGRRLSLLKSWESGSAAQKKFFGLAKNLTIQGYMSSEYVMTNLTHYELVPGRYHGCVDLKTS